MQSKVRIDRIPSELLRDAWPLAVPFLMKGTKACQFSIFELTAQLINGRAELWIISDICKREAVGALLTSSHGNHGYLLMYALGGRNVWAWARALHATVYAYAMRSGFGAVRFYGRNTWARFFPDCRAIGASKLNRHTLFERALP